MTGLIFSFFLVGIPAFIAGSMFAAPASPKDRSLGLGLLLYAAALALTYVLLNPDGKILVANYKLKMPLSLFAGLVAGFVWGWRSR